jgi:hypothetical protein
MQGVIDFLYTIVQWFFALVMAVLNSLVAMFKDIVCLVFDQMLELDVYVIGLIDFDFLSDGTLQGIIDSLPVSVMNIFWLLGLPYAMGIILSAITIRALLQLIPMTRLGS